MTTGAAATSRCVRRYTAAATRSNTTPTKNTRRPSRRPSRRARTTLIKVLRRFEESKALFRKIIAVARRVLGESDDTTLRMRLNYGQALYRADGATLEDLREAVTTLEDTERTARRVLGGARPLTISLGNSLHESREILADRETPPPSA